LYRAPWNLVNGPEGLGACPTLTVLLRQAILNHLCRSRSWKILNAFRRVRHWFFRACGRAPGRISFASLRRSCGQAPRRSL